jgi:thiol:disulfide interchange protein DsbD
MTKTKYIAMIVALFIGASHLFAQQVEVKTSAYSDSIQIELVIPKGWHIYSMDSNPNIGPIPTEITFEKNESIQFIGRPIEPKPIKKYDKNFQGDLLFFDNQVVFTQKVKIKESTELKGSITYMMCNDSKCLPPIDKDFIINLKK